MARKSEAPPRLKIRALFPLGESSTLETTCDLREFFMFLGSKMAFLAATGGCSSAVCIGLFMAITQKR